MHVATQYLFLEVEGVLGVPAKRDHAGLVALEAFLRAHPAVRVIVTSPQRHARPLADWAAYFAADLRARVIDVTPDLSGEPAPYRQRLRQKEILAWLFTWADARCVYLALDHDRHQFEPAWSSLLLNQGEQLQARTLSTLAKRLHQAQQAASPAQTYLLEGLFRAALYVRQGTPCFVHSAIPLADVFALSDDSYSDGEIHRRYPELTRLQINATTQLRRLNLWMDLLADLPSDDAPVIPARPTQHCWRLPLLHDTHDLARIALPADLLQRAGWQMNEELDVALLENGEVQLTRSVPGALTVQNELGLGLRSTAG